MHVRESLCPQAPVCMCAPVCLHECACVCSWLCLNASCHVCVCTGMCRGKEVFSAEKPKKLHREAACFSVDSVSTWAVCRVRVSQDPSPSQPARIFRPRGFTHFCPCLRMGGSERRHLPSPQPVGGLAQHGPGVFPPPPPHPGTCTMAVGGDPRHRPWEPKGRAECSLLLDLAGGSPPQQPGSGQRECGLGLHSPVPSGVSPD